MKGPRGGKYADSSSSSSGEEIIKQHGADKQSSKSWTYDFYNPELGANSYPGNNKQEALKDAKKAGYKASDLVKRHRR